MKKIILAILLCASFLSCTHKLTSRELGAYNYKTTCVSYSNGKLLVVGWGRGLTQQECETNALKTAIYDVVFKGINEGNTNCTQPPILPSADAETKYQAFTNNLLTESGNFRAFAFVYNIPNSPNYRKKIRKLDNIENMALEFQIQVDRAGLVKLFKDSNIKN